MVNARCSFLIAMLWAVSASAAAQLPMAVNADPNAEAMQLAVGSGLRVMVGMPLPVHRGERLNITAGGAVEVANRSFGAPFPSEGWRGLARFSIEKRFEHGVIGAHLFHESDHRSIGHGLPPGSAKPFLFLNAVGTHGRWRFSQDKTIVDLGGALRMHVQTCNRREISCDEPDQALGFEVNVAAAVAYQLHTVVALYGSVFGTLLAGGPAVATEYRAILRAGLVFPTEQGDWTAFGELRAGNEIGFTRQNRSLGYSLGARYTVPFAD